MDKKGAMEMENLNAVGEITEMLYVAAELEKYAHLNAVGEITEELYFARHEDERVRDL